MHKPLECCVRAIKDTVVQGRHIISRISSLGDTTTPETLVCSCAHCQVMSVYELASDGFGETSEKSRSLKEGEVAEWVLLDGVSDLGVYVVSVSSQSFLRRQLRAQTSGFITSTMGRSTCWWVQGHFTQLSTRPLTYQT